MEHKVYYIYTITNTQNQKVYVGQTVRPKERWSQHRAYSKRVEPIQYIHRAMAKCGADVFTFTIVDFAFSSSHADCLETNYIMMYDSRNKDRGYNVSLGGDAVWNRGLPTEQQPMYGKKHSDKTKIKISESNMGKIMPPCSQEWKDKVSLKLKGRKRSQDHTDKIVAARIQNGSYAHTEATKEKISKIQIGKTRTPPSTQTKNKISQKLKGKKNALGVKRTSEQKAHLSNLNRAFDDDTELQICKEYQDGSSIKTLQDKYNSKAIYKILVRRGRNKR